MPPIHPGDMAEYGRWCSEAMPPEPGSDWSSTPDAVAADPSKGHAGFKC